MSEKKQDSGRGRPLPAHPMETGQYEPQNIQPQVTYQTGQYSAPQALDRPVQQKTPEPPRQSTSSNSSYNSQQQYAQKYYQQPVESGQYVLASQKPPTPTSNQAPPMPNGFMYGQPQASSSYSPQHRTPSTHVQMDPQVSFQTSSNSLYSQQYMGGSQSTIGSMPPAFYPQNPPARMGMTLYRYNTVQTIPLTPSGNFVVEIPVPTQVLQAGNRKEREFTHLRYTAVTGDPDEFVQRGYTLRQAEYNRTTELFVVITMYNEDQDLFLKTWTSLVNNINHMCRKPKSAVFGPEGWKKIVICIVSDGRSKINQKTLALIGALGAYQEGLVRTKINKDDVSAHVFEVTTQVSLDAEFQPKTDNFPVQVLFCLKEKNAKKINSHRWFFNAFGRVLNPNVCVLIDVGTKPTDQSLYYLWKEFDADPRVAGACGEIFAEQGNCGSKLLNPLVAAQNFEYKMSNILDKPLESMFGFISVLPGAFSAYRFRALQNRGDGVGPLEKYFIGEKMHGGNNLVMANMYLAEDRILCFELVTKRDESWVLRYIKRAKAETDVPDAVPEFVSQRRRWLNGSFFAGLHAIIHFYQIFRSGHTLPRKFLLVAQMLYNVVTLLFNWFSLSFFFLAFYFLGNNVVQSYKTDPFFGVGVPMFIALRSVYIFAIVVVLIASLGNRPQGSKILYTLCFSLFALIMALMLYMSGFTIHLAVKSVVEQSTVTVNGVSKFNGVTFGKLVTQSSFRDLVISFIATYGMYIIASIVYLDPWHMFTSFLQYLLLLPSFVNILMVYAFCNLHDVSWGTKGDNKVADQAVVKTEKVDGQAMVTVDLPTNQRDIDANWYMFMKAIKPNPNPEKPKKATLSQEDYFKSFRTRLVLFWILSNAILVVLLTTPQISVHLGVNLEDPTAFNPFLSFIFWSVAVLAGFRFLGSMLYMATQNRKRRGKKVKKSVY